MGERAAILASSAICGALGYIWGQTIAKKSPKTSSDRKMEQLIKSLEAKNATLAKEHADLLAQLAQLKVELTTVADQLSQESTAKATVQEQQKAAQAKVNATEEELKRAKVELEKVQAELRQASGTSVSRLSPTKTISANGRAASAKGNGSTKRSKFFGKK